MDCYMALMFPFLWIYRCSSTFIVSAVEGDHVSASDSFIDLLLRYNISLTKKHPMDGCAFCANILFGREEDRNAGIRCYINKSSNL